MACVFSFTYGQVNKLPNSNCQIIVDGTNITLVGQQENVMATRTELFNLYPSKVQVDLNVLQHVIPSRIECEKIAQETNTNISITEQTIHISGIPKQVHLAKLEILVLLDKTAGLSIDTVNIPFKLHNLICGRKRTGLESILNDTLTFIYFPTYEHDIISIAGLPHEIPRVKEMLSKLATQKAQSMYQKDTVLHPRKLDWMLLHCTDETRKIMRDNGSFISFPNIASGNNLVTVYAENRVNTERTIRSLHHLACSIYEACFYFNLDHSIYDGSHSFFNSVSNISSLVSQLAQLSSAQVSFTSDPNLIHVFGTDQAIRTVYQRLHEMSFLRSCHASTKFNVELSDEQREFISGKKSGKINKIMKTSGAKIKFLPFNEYNFLIEVESSNFNKALDGLTLLQAELPAEISFHVPELYHKRIIGVGGKNIQRIMKKYGVYVKFSNAEEFAALGGYYDNQDNVVARTPMKNQLNLDLLKQAVMDLVSAKEKDRVEHVLYDIPFWFHRTLRQDQDGYLADVLKKTDTCIIWPDHELASDSLVLMGPESQVTLAAQMILSIIPVEYDLSLPLSTHLSAVLDSDSFKEIVDRIKKEYNIDVMKHQNENNTKIIFKTTKGNLESLNIALEVFVQYFKHQQVSLYEDGHLRQPVHNKPMVHTNGSFAGFDSKILPPSALASDLVSPTTSTSSLLTDFPTSLKSYSLFDYPSDNSWKNFKEMNTRTTDSIRAIFDTPALPLAPPSSFRGGANDIWSNSTQSLSGFMNNSGLDTKQNSMLYHSFYPSTSSNRTEFSYVLPTSSASTGSNNSSMHSSQTMPEIDNNTSPKKTDTFQNNNNNNTPPPLIYNNNQQQQQQQFALPTTSTPTSGLFSSPDETVFVQNLLNNMSI